MYHGVYFIWGLLPFALLALSAWAIVKRTFRVPGREYPERYFKQFVYAAVCLFFTILIDQYFYEDAITMLSGGMLDPGVVRFALYPFVLLLSTAIPLGKKAPAASNRQRFVMH